MDFTIGGETFSLDAKQVEHKLKNVKPEPIQKLFVVVGERRFPVKQALAVSTGLMRVGFTTLHAFRMFRKLGFELGEE
jgi:hypothetical protein